MAKVTGKHISEVADSGPGLAFVAYPSALNQLPFAQFWSVLFFVMLIFVAIDGQFVCVEGFVTACTDRWPKLRKRRMAVLGVTCFVSFLTGIIFVTEGGIYWFEIFNTYSCAGWAMLLIMLFQCAAVSYGYGVNKYYENVKSMIGYYPGRFWSLCWSIITPGMCAVIY
jgi:solute carrier family 6 GABA transporter-like protein 1